MSAKRGERSRWVTVFTLYEPSAENGATAKSQHLQLSAVVKAFADVGRVLRLEPAKYGNAILVKARRA